MGNVGINVKTKLFWRQFCRLAKNKGKKGVKKGVTSRFRGFESTQQCFNGQNGDSSPDIEASEDDSELAVHFFETPQ